MVLFIIPISCHNSYRMPHKYLYTIDGYMIWTSHAMVPRPEMIPYNVSFDLFLFDKRDAEIYWDKSRYNIRIKNEPARVLVLQGTTSALRQPTEYFYYFFRKSNQLHELKSFSNEDTKFVKGVFLVKKGYVWREYGKIARETFNNKAVHKISFNGLDSVLIRPIWGFDYVEALEIIDIR